MLAPLPSPRRHNYKPLVLLPEQPVAAPCCTPATAHVHAHPRQTKCPTAHFLLKAVRHSPLIIKLKWQVQQLSILVLRMSYCGPNLRTLLQKYNCRRENGKPRNPGCWRLTRYPAGPPQIQVQIENPYTYPTSRHTAGVWHRPVRRKFVPYWHRRSAKLWHT